ncbi:MAG: Nitro FeMo-Co protein [Acidobacteriota bacterium]|nr:Nitro FeMo-Co protein [Acidobacteriota bacterium]
MKVAVSMFKEGVSPRLDIADSLWIYRIDKDRETATLQEKCRITCEQPSQLIRLLKEKGISTIVCSGCPHFFLRMLVFHGVEVEVAPGIMGDPDRVLNRLAQGKPAHASPAQMDELVGRYRRRRCCSGNKLSKKNKEAH